MPVDCEFINILIPISKINELYLGGFESFKKSFREAFEEGPLWHDDFLLRDGAMSPAAAEYSVDEWLSLVLVGHQKVDGQEQWVDICVLETLFRGPSLPCPWIKFDLKGDWAAHVDDSSRAIIGRKGFSRPIE